MEEFFGWMKTVGGMRKLRHRGLQLVGWMFTFAARPTTWCGCEISRPFQRCKVGPKCVPLGMQLDRKSQQTSEINRLNITNDEN